MQRLALTTFAILALASLPAKPLSADGRHAERVAARHAQTLSWHGPYYNTTTGNYVALIVPPTAQMQVNWGWGVSQSSMTPIYHRFSRRYPGAPDGQGVSDPCLPTPVQPSHTSQFGVYYVRGPY